MASLAVDHCNIFLVLVKPSLHLLAEFGNRVESGRGLILKTVTFRDLVIEDCIIVSHFHRAPGKNK